MFTLGETTHEITQDISNSTVPMATLFLCFTISILHFDEVTPLEF